MFSIISCTRIVGLLAHLLLRLLAIDRCFSFAAIMLFQYFIDPVYYVTELCITFTNG